MPQVFMPAAFSFETMYFGKETFMKKGAIFDMDGLMFDTESVYYICWKKTAESYGRTFEEQFYRSIQGANRTLTIAAINKYYPGIEPLEFIEKCHVYLDEMLSVHVPVKKGLYELLTFFKENGVKMAVASSTVKHRILSNLEKTNVLSYFDVVLSGHQVANGKPAPDVFLLAAKEMGLEPADCYVFEDSFNGIRAGAAAGCTTIMVPDLVEPNDEIRGLYDGEYESLLAVKDALQKNLI